MILFFRGNRKLFAVQTETNINEEDIAKLRWLFGEAEYISDKSLQGFFTGPRKEMITPWSTNAVEITQNMGIKNISRIEEFEEVNSENVEYDPMLKVLYKELNQEIFTVNKKADEILHIENIEKYNETEGLALSDEEIEYLKVVSKTIGRPLTDSEIFGFSQVNSEHCRHKIFNGTFIIDGEEKEESLFALIKKTSKTNPNKIVSAYSDNVAFIEGPKAEQFAPAKQDKADFFETKEIDTVISLKAETHNFPTTVEPFNGAATGSGGEIRDRIAGGKGSMPIAGTAVYMTSYPRLDKNRDWEKATEARKWLYQTPAEILIKASNGASDFGNKFGQPLICGSVLTFEHSEQGKKYGFDKVIMLAGGIGYAKKQDSLKNVPKKGDIVILLGGDNYRIGMGGGAVSSVATGEFKSKIELNAVQRSNPEMQKRAYNTIRALAESDKNPIISVHDHGAGGHLNALSELVEGTGGIINIDKLPLGDPTLSDKEIVGNESQERMGLVINKKDIERLRAISERERSPMYEVGEVTEDMNLRFARKNGKKPIDLKLEYMFGKPPKTILRDKKKNIKYADLNYSNDKINKYLEQLLQLEAVACKDWLTNKVDRSVTGRIAMQQAAGKLQLPLNNLGIVALDYNPSKITKADKRGISTSIGHAPVSALIDAKKGSVLSIAEALTNIVFAPLTYGIKGISLSANWMWAAKNEGENARLYEAVKSASDFAIDLGINIPTGKDSLSMTQKYDNEVVYAPGTVIISATAEVKDINKAVSPALKNIKGSCIIYIDFSADELKLGGSSFAQINNKLGTDVPSVKDADYFKRAFRTVQELISGGKVLSGHDVASGGLITTLLEMNFADNETGMDLTFSGLMNKYDLTTCLFNENPAVVIQTENKDEVCNILTENNLNFTLLGTVTNERELKINKNGIKYKFDIDKNRDLWFKTSYLLDKKQTKGNLAEERYKNYKKQELQFIFPKNFKGLLSAYNIDADRKERTNIKAAVIREKGVNGDREMAYSMHLAGFDTKDIHITDLISGRENLEDVNFIVFVGGFSNSDVLGSAKGWAGAFLYNEKAKKALNNFYKRNDTLSLGVCNGCQLMVELGLIYPEHKERVKMEHNDSHKFESGFLTLDIPENKSVMLSSLSNTRLGVWVAHGEGKFSMPKSETAYNIVAKYSYSAYPANPNGSDYNTAAICSKDGRHLAIMPHLERSIFPWQWAYYGTENKNTEVSPWIEAFVNARKWIENKKPLS